MNNPHAVALGKMARGVRKTITAERRAQLVEQLRVGRERRWKCCPDCDKCYHPGDEHRCVR